MSDYKAARHNMIENQIRANKVTDPRILEAFDVVPRERFVPKNLEGIAYADAVTQRCLTGQATSSCPRS